MNDKRVDDLLKRVMGLDPESIGHAALERAVMRRVEALAPSRPGIATPDDYWRYLDSSESELQALIDEVVVPETWFFRDPEAFVALARLARDQLAKAPGRPVRILSLPCSSGEEPYSMAMAMLDAGIPAANFTIDAADISVRSIDVARHARYGRNSFRGHQLAFRERHFTPADTAWVLAPRVRDAVRLHCANLFGELGDGVLVKGGYDFVFCRNVLIYFDRPVQDRAIGVLDALLAPGGTIFVGPAETGLMMRHALSPARIPLAFAFWRTEPGTLYAPRPAAPVPSSPRPRPATATEGRAQGAGHSLWPRPAGPVASAAAAAANTAANTVANMAASMAATTAAAANAVTAAAGGEPLAQVSLDTAHALANAGRLDEAAAAVDALVARDGPTAGAFYLFGLIADARGHGATARACYRKVLYLDPNHHEALAHLATLLALDGDERGAALLNARVHRMAAAAAPAGSASGGQAAAGGAPGERRAGGSLSRRSVSRA
jgi:chemotaxis protein methyltransferase WspC